MTKHAARKRRRTYTLGLRAPIDAQTRGEWGDRLRAARERRGMRQQDLADVIGCTRATVSAWERGITAPSPEVRAAIASALGRHPARLFPMRRRLVA